jgi:hypothetical protein
MAGQWRFDKNESLSVKDHVPAGSTELGKSDPDGAAKTRFLTVNRFQVSGFGCQEGESLNPETGTLTPDTLIF